MKHTLVLSLFLIGMIGCTPSDKEAGPSTKPFEHFYFQRSYPLATMDYKAFDAAMEQAKHIKQQKSGGEDWRLEGPTNIGGRINCIEVDPTNEDIIYVGNANGGVFKTTDGGTNWLPITDDLDYLPIGDIAIDPNDHNVIYVGTGDPNISSSPHIGFGVYKSTDGGNSWNHMGLVEQRIVSRIAINPLNSQIVYAATMGIPFERNNDRGLYRSTNGGATWEQVLFVSDEAGIIDLVMDPVDPQTLYAAAWNRIRNNVESLVAGTDAKIYKTTDGGNNWSVLVNGLPTGEQSRIGLAISQTDPHVVFAQYVGTDLELEGLYRTTDAGVNWQSVNLNGVDMGMMAGFGWYFGKIRVNPADHDHISILGVEMYSTFDGGANWEQSVPDWWTYEVHADKHDMTYLPSGAVLLATDGGLYKCDNTDFTTWYRVDDIPNTQFYRVTVNPHESGVYAGGAQDNGTMAGNYLNLDSWPRIFGGDGFQPYYDPFDPDYMYCETQNGNLVYLDTWGGNVDDFTDGLNPGDRRSWDMPYIRSAHDQERFYTGTYRVYQHDFAPFGTWVPISTDLTDGVIFGDRFHTISTVAESPLAEQTLYAGTTDGNVWRTLNGGTNWDNITAGLPDHYVTDIKASAASASVVYVTHSGYKMNEFIPHVHRSDNNGDTWTDISGDLPQTAVNHIEVYNDSIFFVATDDGVYGTLNNGTNWERLGNMPLITVTDIEIDLAENRLVAGTFSRSMMSFPLDVFLEGVPTGMEESERRVSDVYPNPARDEINFTFEGKGNLRIYDHAGRQVKEINGHSSQNPVSVQDLGPGTYLYSFTDGSTAYQGRFVKIGQ